MIQLLTHSLNLNVALRTLFASVATVLLTVPLWVLGACPAQATGVYSMPNVTAGTPTWVIDQAGVLSRLTKSDLDSKLETLAAETGQEVRFVTIHRLDYGETAETFTQQLFEKWFPTAEEQDNQVLLVLDNVTNSTAIQAGKSAKALLSDEAAESVAQETVMVPLRNGNKYNQAFTDARDRLVAILTGAPDPGPPVVETVIQTEGTFAKAEETDDRSATVIVVVLLVVATVVPMATYYLYKAIES